MSILIRFTCIIYSLISVLSFASELSSKSIINEIDDSNDVFQTIINEYSGIYQKIGQSEAQRILTQKDLALVGGLNSIGLSYQRPFATFNLILNRTLAPDLFDSKRWIVTDTCSIEVDAIKILTKLKNEKYIKISEKNLLAYAGIVFRRDYTWIHFANSYEAGLTTQFEKLFFPFTKITKDKLTNLEDNEIILREDKISSSAGALATLPLGHGISAVAGGFSKYQTLSKLEIIGHDDKFLPPHLQFNLEKTNSLSLGISVELQIYLLNILRFKLFQFESSFDKADSHKFYLDIPKSDLNDWRATSLMSIELDKILMNKELDLECLARYVISKEKRLSLHLSHKYNFIIFGGLKDAKTEKIEIISDGKTKSFFRHNYEKIKFQESLMSKAFTSLIFALTHTDANPVKLVAESKKISIEYEHESNLIDSKKDLSLGNNNAKFSMVFKSEFTSKEYRKAENNLKNKLIYYTEHLSNMNPEIQKKIKESQSITPFEFQSRYYVNANGLRHFNSLSVDFVFDNISAICEQYPKNKYINFRNMFDHCKNIMIVDYLNYLIDLTHDQVNFNQIDFCENSAKRFIFSPGKKRAYLKNCLLKMTLKNDQNLNIIPLWALKNLVDNFSRNIEDKVFYLNLFGIENVFHSSTLYFVSDYQNGYSFYSFSGAFDGYGIIEKFKNDNLYRLPASIEWN